MRTSTAVLVVAALVVVAACSNSEPRPAPVRNYGPEASGTYAQAQPPADPRWVPPTAPVGTDPHSIPSIGPVAGWRWHTRLADAQADARAQGKLILVMSTKPNCGLCEKFKTQVVPQTVRRVQPMAVGYVYDITRPEVREVDRTLRGNLHGADLMPLVAFLTPDLRFVHGFWGARTPAQFRSDIDTATRIYPVRSAAVERTQTGPVLSAVVNEYGEPEWSPPGDVWPAGEPEPIDAITGSPEPADAASVREPDATARVATPPASLAAAPALVPAPPPPPAVLVPDGAIRGIQAPVIEPAPAPVAVAPPVAEPAPQPEDAGNWGDRALQLALADIRRGRFGVARSTLDQVVERLPDTTQAREAARGSVALYNAKRIRHASSGEERSRYLSRARRDLGNSMWGVLFGS